MRLLTNSENHFKKPYVILIIVPDAVYGMHSGENWPIAKKQRRNSTNDREDSSILAVLKKSSHDPVPLISKNGILEYVGA
jgi:hypothetical protein